MMNDAILFACVGALGCCIGAAAAAEARTASETIQADGHALLDRSGAPAAFMAEGVDMTRGVAVTKGATATRLAPHALLAPRYLVPDQYYVEPGREVHVRLVQVAAPGGDMVRAWEEHPAQWFFVRTGASQDNFDDVPLAGGRREPGPDGRAQEAPPASVRILIACTAMIGVDLRDTIVEASRQSLLAFAGDAADGGRASIRDLALLAHPDGTAVIRLRRVESAGAVLRSGQRGHDLARPVATAKTGQNVEIRLLMDPVAALVGGDIPVRAYVLGGGHEGRVFATAMRSGRVQEFATDERGIGAFALDEPGPWRLELHHLAPAENDIEADWILYTATMTFEARNEGADR